MATIEEMTAWTLEEIQAEIRAALPEKWRFEFLTEDGQWRTRFLGVEGECLWWRTYLEPRVLLLDAYGWLWRQQHRQLPTNPAWIPRDRRKLVPVGKVGLQGVTVPDPEDLNPDEIDAVYQGRPTKP
jgi:hypothetical protein